jgi:nanoRNase/pAp phosphatase (c-di-AMP/oligoRNAs hydrolase)
MTSTEAQGNGAPPAGPPPAVARFRRLIDLARGRRAPLIHLQHNPDPDAVAAAVGLQYLLERVLGPEAVLAYTGTVGRAENRAMLRWLKIQIVPSFKIDYAQHDLIIVVDTHPGAGTCRLPRGVVPHVVVDHHPTRAPVEGVALDYQDTAFGSTSTMVGALLLENGIPIDARVATALTYGIRTDTLDLARSENAEDERVFQQVYALADKRLLGRIERARVPQDYFQTLENGLRRALITDFAVTTYVGPIGYGDAVAEIADMLFRLEGIKWVMVGGERGAVLYLSIRALAGEGVDAGAVARDVTGGHGGGHETFAGAQVPFPAAGADPREFFEEIRDRFLKEIRAKKSLTRPLTLPPDVQTEESVVRRLRPDEPEVP